MKSVIAAINKIIEQVETAIEVREDNESEKAVNQTEVLQELLVTLEEASDSFEADWE